MAQEMLGMLGGLPEGARLVSGRGLQIFGGCWGVSSCCQHQRLAHPLFLLFLPLLAEALLSFHLCVC
eukprot:3841808-Amphidinium_carterae.1